MMPNYKTIWQKNNERAKRQCPTALSNEIIVNVDGNSFIVIFKAKYALSPLAAPAAPSWTPIKSPNSTPSLAGATSSHCAELVPERMIRKI